MRKIDPTTLYSTKELREILRGVVSVNHLRQYGLTGSPGSGYWGQNVIDSLNHFWDHLVRQRSTGKVGKENHLVSKKPKRNEVQNRTIHTQSGKPRAMESERERFRRLVSEDSVPCQGSKRGRKNGRANSLRSSGSEK